MKHPQPGDTAKAKLYWYWSVKSEAFLASTWKFSNDPEFVLISESAAQFTVPEAFKYTPIATAELQATRDKVVAEFTAKLRDIDTALANLQAITWEAPATPVVEPLVNEDFQRGYAAAEVFEPRNSGYSAEWLAGYDDCSADTPEAPQ